MTKDEPADRERQAAPLPRDHQSASPDDVTPVDPYSTLSPLDVDGGHSSVVDADSSASQEVTERHETAGAAFGPGALPDTLVPVASIQTQQGASDPHGTRINADGDCRDVDGIVFASETAVEREAVASMRLRVLHVHARGGLGLVSLAHDDELEREVALKEIHAQFAHQRGSRQRFLSEARITGRLEHPGIVPIYGMGQYSDGRPYYVMRFIRGDTLQQRIERYHQADGLGRDPGQRLLDLHHLLGHFIAVCNTIAYAHSRGVLHRDLKPANVMLGEYGETLVVDWGLAKILNQPEPIIGEPPTQSSPSTGGGQGRGSPASSQLKTDTQVGAIIGTPHYMSPEQAAGRVDRLGPVSDIYSLGATLYCLLTNRSPLEGGDIATLLEKVQNGEFARPRQVNPKVPRALEAICLKAMAVQPEDRYPSAKALAGDIEKWMADEPVSAWREPWYVRTRRWIGRHRTFVASLASALVVAVVSLAIVRTVREASAERERQRVARLRSDAQQLVYQGETARAIQDWQNVKLFSSSALAQISDEPELADLRDSADQLLGQANRQMHAAELRQQALAQYQQFVKRHDDALFHYGTLFTSTNLPADLQRTRTAILRALEHVGVNVDARDSIIWNRDFRETEQAEITQGCYGLLLMLAEITVQEESARGPDKRRPSLEKALGILDRAAQVSAVSQAYHLRRSRFLEQLGKTAAASKEAELARQVQPVHAVDYFLLGDEWYRRGRLTEAVKAFDRAVELQPDDFWSQFFLALGYLEARRPVEARAGLTACLSRRPDFAWLYVLRGMVRGGADEFQQAEADFDRALQLQPNRDARYVLLVYRGGMRSRQGRADAAVADLKQAAALMPERVDAAEALILACIRGVRLSEAKIELERASQRWPKAAGLWRLRAQLALASGDREGALSALESAIKLEPRASDHLERGRLFLQEREYEKAAQACAAALQLQPDLAAACVTKVKALMQQDKHGEAVEACTQFLQRGNLLAEIVQLRAEARSKLGDHAGAVDDYSRLLVAGENATVHIQRGWEYIDCQSWPLALRDFEEALRLESKNDIALSGRALARAYVGNYREAVTDAEAALQASPGSSVRTYNVACTYALAASKVTADTREPTRQMLAAGYKRRAVALLQKSMELLPADSRLSFWRETVDKDTALESIRNDDGYRQLQARFGKTSP